MHGGDLCTWGCLGSLSHSQEHTTADTPESGIQVWGNKPHFSPCPQSSSASSHLCVGEFAGAITGANTRSLSLTEHCPKSPPKMCIPCPLSNLRLCSLDCSHHKSSHPSRVLAPLKSESSAILSELEPVWGYNVSQALFHGGTGIPEHATAPSTGGQLTASPS